MLATSIWLQPGWESLHKDTIAQITLLISVITTLVSISGLVLGMRQLRRAVSHIRSSTYQSVYQLMIDLDRFFIEKPYFKPYFYPDATWCVPEGLEVEQLYSVAEMTVDYFDNVYQQQENFPPGTFEGFVHFMQDVYAHSCILQSFLRISGRTDWYPEGFLETLREKAGEYAWFPARASALEPMSRLEEEVFEARDAVPLSVLQAWYEANPQALTVLEHRGRGSETPCTVVGQVIVLPLRPPALARLLEGATPDAALAGDDLFRQDERKAVQHLYVESLIVRPEGEARRRAMELLARDFAFMVTRVCNPTEETLVYAAAATQAGERLLDRLGFERPQELQKRVDGHPVFVIGLFRLLDALRRIRVRVREEGQGQGTSTAG